MFSNVAAAQDEVSPSASTISTKASMAAGATATAAAGAAPSVVMVSKDDTKLTATKEEETKTTTTTPAKKSPSPSTNVDDASPHRMMHAQQLLSLKTNGSSEENVNANNKESAASVQQHEDEAPDAKRRKISDVSMGPSPTEALDGRAMAPHPPTDRNHTHSLSPTGEEAASQQSNQSLEYVGAMPSWDTAAYPSRPLAGWSVCSGISNGLSAASKDAHDAQLLGSAFSFSDAIQNNNGHHHHHQDRRNSKTKTQEESSDTDPSPKSILSKVGEKKKLAPGTHVQFSRGEKADAIPSLSRKRERDEYGYYYGEYPPRHHHPHYPPYPTTRRPYHHEDPHYHHQPYGPPPPHAYGPPPSGRRHPAEYAHPPPYGSYPPRSRSNNGPQSPPSKGPSSSRGSVNPTTGRHEPPIVAQFTHKSSSSSPNGKSHAPGTWTRDADKTLVEILREYKNNPKNRWDDVTAKFNSACIGTDGGGESTALKTSDIKERWVRHLKPGAKKGQWTDEEDAIVSTSVLNSPEEPFSRWSELAKELPGRVGKQVRDRWVNHLNPAISRLPFTKEEVSLIS